MVFAVPACPDRAAGERHGYKFFEFYECGGTRLIEHYERRDTNCLDISKLSRCRMFVGFNGAVAVPAISNLS